MALRMVQQVEELGKGCDGESCTGIKGRFSWQSTKKNINQVSLQAKFDAKHSFDCCWWSK
jgi:hypothetical protein